MTQPFLALITPIGMGGRPDQGLPGQPPGYWGGVAPPWVDNTLPVPPGGAPPGYWGGVAPPYPDQGLPGHQPRPSHPIAPGGRPPGIWGGGNVPMPSPPIYFPPPGSPPPLGIWGGKPPNYVDIGGPGAQPKPEHPIVLPPGLPPTLPDLGPVDWKTGWTQETGWVIVGVPNEGTTVPTPSKK
jgi:hypothetical protein